MKKAVALALLVLVVLTASAQRKKIDSLRSAVNKAATDTTRYIALHALSIVYYSYYPDSAIVIEQQAFLLAKKNNWVKNQGRSLNNIANAYNITGDYATAIQYYLKALRAHEYIDDQLGVIMVNINIGNLYIEEEDDKKALPYLLLAQKQLLAYTRNHLLKAEYKQYTPNILMNIGDAYLHLKKIDSAKYYLDSAYKSIRNINDQNYIGTIQRDLGEVEGLKGNTKAALQYFRQALAGDKTIDDAETMSSTYLSIARLYHKIRLRDSDTYYAQKALDVAITGNFKQDALAAGKVLYQYYDEAQDLPRAFKYFKLTTAIKDSLYSQDKVKQLLTFDFNEKQRQQELETEQLEAHNRLRTYILSGGLGVLLLLALIFWRNSNQRKKANLLLKAQKREIEVQRDQTNKALTELQQTQSQLIQSEKMASLGELTAGIAHEIQNPLNFVNNFSEVNTELIDEMEQEIEKGDLSEVKAIALDIKENEKKINMHGKRADAIVKGMLQHSQSGSGTKEPTDINALADDYLRLAYHGFQAKDKNFSAGMVTHFDAELPKINVIPQDIGKVILNLFNNAFYAVNQKAKTAGADYKPEVSVETFFLPLQGVGGIKVKDNGVGIPDSIKDKIMQPFFTTKPTGEGTGLGLSLTYDMVVKGHGGSIEVNSVEGEGSEFFVSLPINSNV